VEHAEMLGDVLLGGTERLMQLVDGRRPAAKMVEQLDAHRLTDDPEALGDHLDQRIGKGRGQRHA
jgi:hypothetical protein